MTRYSDSLQAFANSYDKRLEETLLAFKTFLAFPSVSILLAHKKDMIACKDWLAQRLFSLGMQVETWPTTGHPTLFASDNSAGPLQPTLLLYNHYDVQPIDPLEEWHSPPFDPVIRDGNIYARGASDNKGQCFYVIEALRLLKEYYNGVLPINIKMVIEGEEELGSSGLSAILNSKKESLAADYLAIVDLGIPHPNQPAVTLGTRGLLTMTIEMQGSTVDLHSGSHGGIVYNPLHAMVKTLSGLRDENGKIAVEGFYDDVKTMTKEEREQVDFDFDADEYYSYFGCRATGGEKGFSPLERAWIRPTIEINGIHGGYGGLGCKTVIPAKAIAKISCRLVPEQDPMLIGERIAKHLYRHTPEGIAIAVKLYSGLGPALRTSPDASVVKAFRQAYTEVFEIPCKNVFEGGSIPIISELADASGAEVVMIGVALPDDQIHAPNEKFSIDRLKKGALMVARGIELLKKDLYN